MPNRIIKDSIRTSRSVNNMTDFQFRLWVYLITYVDDYGRGSADPEIIKGFVFPRRKGVTESTIEKALADLANSGSVILYEVDGEPYFCFPNWGDHQRIQTKKSKHPAPEDGKIILFGGDIAGGGTVNGDLNKSTVNHRGSLPESNPNPNPNPNPKPNARAREEDFESFWSEYPRKEGRKKAFEAFKKVQVPLENLLQAVRAQKSSDQWKKDNGRFIPHAATWLNGERWNDVPCENDPWMRELSQDEMDAIRRIMEES